METRHWVGFPNIIGVIKMILQFIISNIGEAINNVINQNFDVISKDIIPLVEKALQRLLKRISSKILENFTYDQVFPQ